MLQAKCDHSCITLSANNNIALINFVEFLFVEPGGISSESRNPGVAHSGPFAIRDLPIRGRFRVHWKTDSRPELRSIPQSERYFYRFQNIHSLYSGLFIPGSCKAPCLYYTRVCWSPHFSIRTLSSSKHGRQHVGTVVEIIPSTLKVDYLPTR